uniref:Uncharacterized protein n=1 Tax=Oryza brachyantha TaxID=4533 RepID=J3L3C6_ORYBR
AKNRYINFLPINYVLIVSRWFSLCFLAKQNDDILPLDGSFATCDLMHADFHTKKLLN